MKRWLLGMAMLAAGGAALAQAAVEPSAFIAGTMPDRRPVAAPVIREAAPLDEKHALRGIATPYPASLGFIKDQGAWYTPFTRPGMTAPYDLRGYHRP